MLDRRGSSAQCLYARLLGPSWSDVHESVRRAHEAERGVRAAGTFRITHSRSVIGRIVSRACRLPDEGDAVVTRLVIRRNGDGERWWRRFGTRLLVTTQRWVAPQIVSERFGMLDLAFQLAIHERGLKYSQIGAAIMAGPIRVPLPKGLAPRVEAIELPDDPSGRTRVRVNIALPGIGQLMSYDGMMRIQEIRR